MVVGTDTFCCCCWPYLVLLLRLPDDDDDVRVDAVVSPFVFESPPLVLALLRLIAANLSVYAVATIMMMMAAATVES